VLDPPCTLPSDRIRRSRNAPTPCVPSPTRNIKIVTPATAHDKTSHTKERTTDSPTSENAYGFNGNIVELHRSPSHLPGTTTTTTTTTLARDQGRRSKDAPRYNCCRHSCCSFRGSFANWQFCQGRHSVGCGTPRVCGAGRCIAASSRHSQKPHLPDHESVECKGLQLLEVWHGRTFVDVDQASKNVLHTHRKVV
jgi:hypothetical protein